MPLIKAIVWAAVVMAGVFVPFEARADEFGWRADGSGIFKGATPPLEWSDHKNISWQTDVGQSYSSPVAIGDKVFVTSEPNDLVCVNATDGKIAWKQKVAANVLPAASRSRVKDFFGPDTSGNAAITPVSDGENVYAVFGSGVVACYGIKSGELKWATLIERPPTSKEGRTASPLLAGGKLIVHLTSLFALDPATGQIKWTQEAATDAWGSPIARKIGKEEIVATPAGDIVRVSDGKIVATGLGSARFSSPVIASGVYYLADESCVALQLPAEIVGDKADTKQILSDSVDGMPYSSPVVIDGLFYVVSDTGKLTIFDVKGGAKVEKQLDLVPDGSMANVHPSIAVAGKYLFLSNDKGRTIVVEAGKEAKVVRVNDLSDGSASSLTFSGSSLFIRGKSTLYCIREKKS